VLLARSQQSRQAQCFNAEIGLRDSGLCHLLSGENRTHASCHRLPRRQRQYFCVLGERAAPWLSRESGNLPDASGKWTLKIIDRAFRCA
jgi:hypothetical protein